QRMEAIGEVRSTSPDFVIKHTEQLDVDFRDVPKLLKPPVDPKDAKDKAGPMSEGGPKLTPASAKDDPIKKEPTKEEPKKEELKKEEPREKKPFVITAQTIKATVNRDPDGHNELDHVHAEGDVEGHQDPATKDELGTDIAGKTVDMQAYPDGNRLYV